MTTGPAAPGQLPGDAPLRTGQDWAAWLRQSRPVAPPGTARQQDGQVPTRARDALVHLARRQGFAAGPGDCAEPSGFTTWPDRRIWVPRDAAPAEAVTALAHQIGHVLLHADIARLDPGGTVPCHGTRKVEADSVAYLVADHLGIDAPAITFPHVSSWAGTDPRARPAATIQTVANRVLAVAATITVHLDTELGPAPELTRRARTAEARETQAASPGPVPVPVPVPLGELAAAHHSAAEFFRSQLPGSWVPDYLTGRGFSPAVQQHWQAGHAPASWHALTSHLRVAGYPDPVIEAAGLARRSRRGTLIDTFRDRVMLPIRSADGTIIAFIGRAPDHAAPGVPRYLNSPGTSLYDKSHVLFGLWEARDALTNGARPVIVEGPLDAIAVTTASPGHHAGLAPCGTALTAHHATALASAADLRTAGVLSGFDPDQAGQRAAVRAYHLLTPLTDQTAAVLFPAGQDPARILAEHGPAALAGMLASRTRPLADLVIDAEVARWDQRLQYAEGQILALRAAAPRIAAMPPAHVARQVARLADRLDLDHPTVTAAVTNAVTAAVAGPAAPDRATIPRSGRRRAGPPAVVRAASRDSPHSARQAVGRAPTATPPASPPANAPQAPLPARHGPG